MAQFTQLLVKEGVRSYLEIGSKYGGSLMAVAKALPVPSRLVCVDLPWGNKASQPVLLRTVEEINNMGHRCIAFLGDSTDELLIRFARVNGPYDAVFIDANHTLPYVTKDWENYGPMATIVAFHDIGFYRKDPMPKGKLPIDVPKFWKSIKGDYPHIEIRECETDNGIGVLWRYDRTSR